MLGSMDDGDDRKTARAAEWREDVASKASGGGSVQAVSHVNGNSGSSPARAGSATGSNSNAGVPGSTRGSKAGLDTTSSGVRHGTDGRDQASLSDEVRRSREADDPKGPSDVDESRTEEITSLQDQLEQLKQELEDLKTEKARDSNEAEGAQGDSGDSGGSAPSGGPQQAGTPGQGTQDWNQTLLQDVLAVFARRNLGANAADAGGNPTAKLQQDYQTAKSQRSQLRPEVEQLVVAALQGGGGAQGTGGGQSSTGGLSFAGFPGQWGNLRMLDPVPPFGGVKKRS